MSRLLGIGIVASLTVACGGAATTADDANGTRDAGGSDALTVDAGALDAGVGDDGAIADGGVLDAGGSSDAGRDTGSILPPLDAGDPFGDAGTLGDPAWAPIEVRTSGTCTALVACGGDVLGTWDVSGGCWELPIGDTVAMCPGASITRAVGRGRGRVIFDGALAHRIAQSEVNVQIFVPSICASFVGGCAGLQTRLRATAPDSACAPDATGNCVCEARQNTTIDQTDAYTTSSTEIIGTVSGKHWAYCVVGTQLTYRDTSPTGTIEPGIIQLTHR